MRMQSLGIMVVVVTCVVAASGCARIKEGVRGALGISTKMLQEYRVDAIKETVPLAYTECFTKSVNALKQMECYIYANKKAQGMLAVYVSESDTTPVGIFFTSIDAASTKVEVSSESSYAKELIAKRLFARLAGKLDPYDVQMQKKNQAKDLVKGQLKEPASVPAEDVQVAK